MDLDVFIKKLPKNTRYKLAIRLCKLALPIWEKYAEENDLVYRDSVVGMTHKVNKKIIQNAIVASEEFVNLNFITKFLHDKPKLFSLSVQFCDPIVALQDLDWELPENILNIFYSAYNLVESLMGKEYTVFDELTIYVSINQSIDAIEFSKLLSIDQIKEILKEYRS